MKYLFAVLCLATVLHAPSASADTSDAEVKAIREQLLALSLRLDQLEQSNEALLRVNAGLKERIPEPAAEFEQLSAHSSAASWAEKIKLNGDFRYRMENIQETGKPDRNRQRIQAHAAIIATPRHGLEIGLGLASGDDDPLSANQTIGDGGSTKDINLDQAYVSWTGIENTSFTAGKFKNILHRAGGNTMIWDGDWNPEGFGVQWDNDDWFANMLGSWIESDTQGGGSEFSYVLQGGFKKKFTSGASLKAGLTYTDFGTGGKGSFFGDDGEFLGNSFDPQTNTYLYNYEEIELFADLSFTFLNKPARLFADYVQNQDADEFDTAYAIGLTLGTAKNYGDWSVGWIYQDVEADSILGLIADSDFGGGGPDAKGHIFKGAYGLGKYLNANISYFVNEFDENLGTSKDHDRFQINLNFKY